MEHDRENLARATGSTAQMPMRQYGKQQPGGQGYGWRGQFKDAYELSSRVAAARREDVWGQPTA